MCKRINEDWVEPDDVQIIKNTNGSIDEGYNYHFALFNNTLSTHFQFAREMADETCLKENRTCGCPHGYDMVFHSQQVSL